MSRSGRRRGRRHSIFLRVPIASERDRGCWRRRAARLAARQGQAVRSRSLISLSRRSGARWRWSSCHRQCSASPTKLRVTSRNADYEREPPALNEDPWRQFGAAGSRPAPCASRRRLACAGRHARSRHSILAKSKASSLLLLIAHVGEMYIEPVVRLVALATGRTWPDVLSAATPIARRE